MNFLLKYKLLVGLTALAFVSTYIPLAKIAGGTANNTVRSNGTFLVSSNVITNDGTSVTITPGSGNLALLGTSSGGAVINLRTTVSAANTTNASRLGALNFRGFQNSTEASGASIDSLAAALWAAGSSPAILRFLTTPSGSTTPVEVGRFTAAGSFYIGTGAIATGATAGQLRAPNCAGVPTATPEGGLGSVVYDTTDARWYGWNGSAWVNLSAASTLTDNSFSSGPQTVTTAMASPIGYIKVTGGITITLNFPTASSATGLTYVVNTTASTGATVHPNGTDNINGANSNVSVTSGYHSKSFHSDGSEWILVDSV